jgi:rubrerythrin
MKTFWKCKVCGDIHYGENAPSPCPTCATENAYSKISKKEAKDAMGL